MIEPRTILSIAIDSIAIPSNRIGFFDAAHAKHLGEDMHLNGQHDPIHLKRNGNAAKLPWTLVAGLHRLRGGASVGLLCIKAIEVAGPDARTAELRRLELSENLDHRQRRPIERAIFMVERARLEEELDHPGSAGEQSQSRAGRARHSASATVADAADWRERTAVALGCSIRSLERYQRLYRALVEALPDLSEQLNFHPLGESLSAMMRLATLKNDATRRRAALSLLSREDWVSMDQVLSQSGFSDSTGKRIDPARLGSVMVGAWNKMPLDARKAHVTWLVDHLTHSMAIEMVAGFKKRGLLP